MTKIKNTKKGMAKKTLSMSLVVAMLATSNVPVWAAEFSDGSDVAVATEAPAEFTDETDAAPVVEDAAEEVSTAQAEADYTVNTNMQLKSDTWAEKLSFEKKNETDKTETFEITKGGIPVDNFYYEVDYNGDDDTSIAIHESQEFARYRCPNLIYQDVEMIKPLIDIPVLVSLEGRIDADSDSLYVLNLFKRHIKTNSDAWKYCVYILQQKNSPLTMHIEKINATSDDILKWGNEYSQKKEQYLKTLRTTLEVIYLVKNM